MLTLVSWHILNIQLGFHNRLQSSSILGGKSEHCRGMICILSCNKWGERNQVRSSHDFLPTWLKTHALSPCFLKLTLPTWYYCQVFKWLDCEPFRGAQWAEGSIIMSAPSSAWNIEIFMDPNIFWQHSYSGLYTILETNSKPYFYLTCMTLIHIPLSKVLSRFKPIFWEVVFVSHSRLLFTTLFLLLWPQKSSTEQYFVFLVSFHYTWEFAFPNQVHQTFSIAHFAFHLTTNLHLHQKAALVNLTSGWVEGSLSHIPEHACRRSTSQHHQSLQRQRGLWFDRERILPSLHYPQTYTIQIGGKKHNTSFRLE